MTEHFTFPQSTRTSGKNCRIGRNYISPYLTHFTVSKVHMNTLFQGMFRIFEGLHEINKCFMWLIKNSHIKGLNSIDINLKDTYILSLVCKLNAGCNYIVNIASSCLCKLLSWTLHYIAFKHFFHHFNYFIFIFLSCHCKWRIPEISSPIKRAKKCLPSPNLLNLIATSNGIAGNCVNV